MTPDTIIDWASAIIAISFSVGLSLGLFLLLGSFVYDMISEARK